MRKNLIILFFMTLLSGCAGLGVATVGAVMYYKSQNHEVATVDIKASANNVYNAALNILNSNPDVEIENQDDSAMLLDIRQADTAATIKIAKINSHISQLTISADASDNNGVSSVLEGAFRICKELNVKCELSNQ
ncbi:DUF3568 domain-containing protein [Moritella viscosa]|uniref:Lipoprotein n=1 Tax=Moritella viscosa TaxID=80854 RepID=A0ABY1HMX4_9GAMM|nr:DUF3568 domain-containing protein [Moritella viscosa]SGY89849.1 Putative lipoprotein [Moritella viscosa]SGY92453.1 Putative lipoprotein [Moritella viscosa]SGZ02629.1 Putative lipoprotein [Moritella viscosa]SHO25268.1 Putative lipoprotein [Moritella viscosa]